MLELSVTNEGQNILMYLSSLISICETGNELKNNNNNKTLIHKYKKNESENYRNTFWKPASSVCP